MKTKKTVKTSTIHPIKHNAQIGLLVLQCILLLLKQGVTLSGRDMTGPPCAACPPG